MERCHLCGTPIKENAKFCTSCGSRVASASQGDATNEVVPPVSHTSASSAYERPQAQATNVPRYMKQTTEPENTYERSESITDTEIAYQQKFATEGAHSVYENKAYNARSQAYQAQKAGTQQTLQQGDEQAFAKRAHGLLILVIVTFFFNMLFAILAFTSYRKAAKAETEEVYAKQAKQTKLYAAIGIGLSVVSFLTRL